MARKKRSGITQVTGSISHGKKLTRTAEESLKPGGRAGWRDHDDEEEDLSKLSWQELAMLGHVGKAAEKYMVEAGLTYEKARKAVEAYRSAQPGNVMPERL
jgi:hypothetical protein